VQLLSRHLAGYPCSCPIRLMPATAVRALFLEQHPTTPSPHVPCIREAERIAANPRLSQLIEAG
jgi:hypothetical protein